MAFSSSFNHLPSDSSSGWGRDYSAIKLLHGRAVTVRKLDGFADRGREVMFICSQILLNCNPGQSFFD
jgi:hypothetical protein